MKEGETLKEEEESVRGEEGCHSYGEWRVSLESFNEAMSE